MVEYGTILYSVFDYLRLRGVPLGVSEYFLAIQTLREGVGVEDVEDCRRLCRLLWAKSREDQDLFDVAFAEFVDPRLRPTEPPSLPDQAHDPPVPPQLPERPDPARPQALEPEPKPESTLTASEQATLATVPLGRSVPLEPYPMESQSRYHLIPRLPMGRRELAGAWRHLRRLQRSGAAEELDLDRTVDQLCQTGVFIEPVLRPRRRNQAGLALLVDQEGSMTPFSLFVDALVESVQKGGLLGQVCLYYFHDCPELVVYEQPGLTRAVPLESVLAAQTRQSILMVSDAGAARGEYDGQRVEATWRFVNTMTTYTYRYAWLNPIPAERWRGTTAEDIAKFVPMFALDRDGLNDAINILRGHPFPPGVESNARSA